MNGNQKESHSLNELLRAPVGEGPIIGKREVSTKAINCIIRAPNCLLKTFDIDNVMFMSKLKVGYLMARVRLIPMAISTPDTKEMLMAYQEKYGMSSSKVLEMNRLGNIPGEIPEMDWLMWVSVAEMVEACSSAPPWRYHERTLRIRSVSKSRSKRSALFFVYS